jgi:hypothetical protein
MRALKYLALLLLLLVAANCSIQEAQAQRPNDAAPVIPKTWDDEAITTLEVPLANPVGSPKHISADYYYRIPVRPIYESYPVYGAGHEPPGYLEQLKQREPLVIWDDKGHKPPLKSRAAPARVARQPQRAARRWIVGGKPSEPKSGALPSGLVTKTGQD